MRKRYLFITLLASILFLSCSTTKKADSSSVSLEKELNEKNRGNIPLITRIKQLPGVTTKNGVPVLMKATNSISNFDNGEPLYILNGQIIGNSFRSINQLVDNYNVKSVKILSGADASTYGSQGAKGVIKITTYNQ